MCIEKLVRDKLAETVAATAQEIHREEYFTVRLFAQLWSRLNERILYSTGLYITQLVPRIEGSDADALRRKYLSKGMDFYADLIVTAPFKNGERPCTLSIADFIERVPVTHLYEFKYLTAFQTLSRKIAREDTYKLQIMGQYVLSATGRLPYLEQFVVMSKRAAKRVHTLESLRNWFRDPEFRKETKNVHISIVDTDGTIHDGRE